MTKQRTTHVLLAVVVALLGLHLALKLSPPKAVAQELEVWPPPPVEIIQISAVGYFWGSGHVNRLYRLWSDGTIEHTRQGCSDFPGTWCQWQVVPE